MNLMNLLLPAGAQAVGLQGAQGAQDTPVGQIDVYGSLSPQHREYILENTRAAPTEDEVSEIIPRKGMFGVKGTLRDVLGTIGDAFLTQSGNERVYAPQRDRERQGDAMYGFSQNPIQAIERLAAAGYVDQAQQLAQQYSIDQARQQQGAVAQQRADATSANYDSQIQARRQKMIDDLRQDTANMLANSTPDTYPQIFELVSGISERNGIGLDELGISEDMTQAQIEAYSRSDFSADQRSREADRDARRELTASEVASRNANRSNSITNRDARTSIARENANRPRGGGGSSRSSGGSSESQSERAKRLAGG